MVDKETIAYRSKQAELLDERIAENVDAQEIDFVEWIFKRIQTRAGSRVLELCCGTGLQTLRLLNLVGHTGHVVALDISREALDKMASKMGSAQLSRLTTIEADIDELKQALDKMPLQGTRFDMVFCAYGLYYSANAEQVLQEAKQRLQPSGAIVIVGPFGPNNAVLFEFLQQSGVDIAGFVKYTSCDFMYEKVIPWATQNFQSVYISTVVNRITWPSPEKILNYWRNSTFYEAEKAASVEARSNMYFTSHSQFINEKWIMMVEMTGVRA